MSVLGFDLTLAHLALQCDGVPVADIQLQHSIPSSDIQHISIVSEQQCGGVTDIRAAEADEVSPRTTCCFTAVNTEVRVFIQLAQIIQISQVLDRYRDGGHYFDPIFNYCSVTFIKPDPP